MRKTTVLVALAVAATAACSSLAGNQRWSGGQRRRLRRFGLRRRRWLRLGQWRHRRARRFVLALYEQHRLPVLEQRVRHAVRMLAGVRVHGGPGRVLRRLPAVQLLPHSLHQPPEQHPALQLWCRCAGFLRHARHAVLEASEWRLLLRQQLGTFPLQMQRHRHDLPSGGNRGAVVLLGGRDEVQQHQHHARPLQVAAAAVRLSCAACSRAVALPTQNDLICPHGGRPDYGNRQRHQQRVNKVDPRLGREPEGHQAGLGLGFVRSICSTVRTGASAESFRNCDPSGSLSNLRLEIPLSVVALRAA